MSLNRKLIAAAIASVVSSVALANETSYTQMPMPTVNYSGIYVEGNAGYVWRDWTAADPVVFYFPGKNQTGGFTGIMDGGYQLNRYISAELGWAYLPKATAHYEDLVSASVTSGLVYVAAKATLPVVNNVYLFGKLGTAYNYNSGKATINIPGYAESIAGTDNDWEPMIAVGVQYYLSPAVSVNVQDMFVPCHNSRVAASPNLLTAGMGYKFMM